VGGKALHPCASPLCMNPALSSPHNLAAPALIHSTPSQTRIAVQTMASSLDPFAHSQKEGLRRTDGSPRNGVKDSLINLSLRVLPLYSESVTDELWRSAWLSWSVAEVRRSPRPGPNVPISTRDGGAGCRAPVTAPSFLAGSTGTQRSPRRDLRLLPGPQPRTILVT
jgi:hypothetical protein